MNDKETLKAAASILTGMGVSLGRIADTLDDETPVTNVVPITAGVQSESAGEATPPPGAAATLVTTPPTVLGVELDIDGLPWDVRIHAGTKTKTAPGAWKKKKGADKAMVEQVIAELKATMAAPTPETVTTAPPPPVTEVPAPPAAVVEQVKVMTEKAGAATYETFIEQGWTDETLIEQGYMTISDAQVNPVVPTPPVVLQAAGTMTFPELAGLVTPAIQSGLITQVEADAESAKHGVDSLALLVSRADIVPAVYASCQALIASRQQ